MIAAALGNLEIAQILIEDKASVTKRDSFGKTALIFAIQNGDY